MTIRVFGGSWFVGDGASDTLLLSAAKLSKARIDLGGGFDTLAITTSGDYNSNSSSYRSLKGVDAFDFSRLGNATLSVTISNSMVSQSDSQRLTVVSGVNGIDSLAASGITAGTLVVAGVGQVNLANGVANKVTIADGALVQVWGGSGNDTITAAATGSTLDGGGGADTLIAGAGADTVAWQAGFGADTVSGFDVGTDTIAFTGVTLPTLNALMDMTTDTASGALINFGNGNSILLQGVSKSALETAAITADGVQLVHVPPTILIGTDTTAAELNAMIASAEAGTTFVLADGVHEFTAAIVIAHDDITLRGQSEDGTILHFSFAPGTEADAIQLTGGAKTYVGLAQAAITAGQDVITLADGHGLTAGDAIYLYQPNTPEYLAANGWTNVLWEDADQRPFREYIVEIESVDGNAIHLKSPVPYSMDLGEARVFVIDMLRNMALSDFTVTYDLGAANPYDFVNTQAGYDGLSAIHLTAASGAALTNISIVDAASNGILLTSSIGVTAGNILVDGSHNKGGDGNGYNILLSESFGNTFTGLDLYNGRHSVVFSAWNAETGNTIEIANTNRDINFHGSPDMGNGISVGRTVLNYDPALDTSGENSTWAIVSGGGASHAATDIYGSNDVAINYAVGSTANDVIHGTDAADYLNAGFGYDTILGGAGDDYIVGGTRKDTMTGGEGSDTFLLRMGDDLDTITDFTFGVDGDTIIFSGNAAVTSMANLTFTQNGADLYVRYGSNSTVILAGHTLADVDAANFAFDPGGAQTLATYNGDFLF
jgi:hypothetical protein